MLLIYSGLTSGYAVCSHPVQRLTSSCALCSQPILTLTSGRAVCLAATVITFLRVSEFLICNGLTSGHAICLHPILRLTINCVVRLTIAQLSSH